MFKKMTKFTCVTGNIFKRLIIAISPISRDLKVFYTKILSRSLRSKRFSLLTLKNIEIRSKDAFRFVVRRLITVWEKH